MKTNSRYATTLGICAIACIAQSAAAYADMQNLQSSKQQETAFFIPVVFDIESHWKRQNYDFTKEIHAPVKNRSDGVQHESGSKEKPLKARDESFVDKVVNKIPYSQSMKYAWDVIDGDVDLYVANLRVDRGNKGIRYKTKSLPMFGEMDGSHLRAEMGDDTKITFESEYVPMIGQVEGFKFKAFAGTDDSALSLRYKIDLNPF